MCARALQKSANEACHRLPGADRLVVMAKARHSHMGKSVASGQHNGLLQNREEVEYKSMLPVFGWSGLQLGSLLIPCEVPLGFRTGPYLAFGGKVCGPALLPYQHILSDKEGTHL
eukprot:1512686-Amphidinium_carterae.1